MDLHPDPTADPAAPDPLRGLALRYVLTAHLAADRRPRSVGELVEVVERSGWEIAGRASKTVSDALRWEVARGRVVRLGRNRYGPGIIPRSTRYRIHGYVRAMRRDVPGRRAA